MAAAERNVPPFFRKSSPTSAGNPAFLHKADNVSEGQDVIMRPGTGCDRFSAALRSNAV